MTRPGLPIRRVARIRIHDRNGTRNFRCSIFRNQAFARLPIWRIDVWILLKEIRAKFAFIHSTGMTRLSAMNTTDTLRRGAIFDSEPRLQGSWFGFIRWKSIKFCLPFLFLYINAFLYVNCVILSSSIDNIIDRAQFEEDWNGLKIVIVDILNNIVDYNFIGY